VTQWLILLCFLLIGCSDYKRRIIPDALIAIIAVLALITRTRIEFYEHLAAGAVACLLGYVLYKVKLWAMGDVKLWLAVGLAFGAQSPYVVLWAALSMVLYQTIRKGKEGLPYGVPVAVGAAILTFW